jgi:hypothetical protein
MFFILPLHYIKALEDMEKKKDKNIFIRMLEIKRAIRDCIQNGGDLKQVEKKYGIKFAKPL